MVDRYDRLSRYRVVEELVLLASPADEQIATFRRSGYPYAELWMGYMNYSYDQLPYLQDRGALSPGIVKTTDILAEALLALREDDTPEAFTEEGIRLDPRWERIRKLAREALVAFSNDLGLPIPRMSDPDYDCPRDDAP
jgi:hypothetical protein